MSMRIKVSDERVVISNARGHIVANIEMQPEFELLIDLVQTPDGPTFVFTSNQGWQWTG